MIPRLWKSTLPPTSSPSFYLFGQTMLEAQALLLFLVLVRGAIAQTTHVVNVGVEGSFYTPPTLSAGLNDTVMFVFGGDAHTVTQSTFEAPCVRLEGGFDSGFNGRGADFSSPPPVWTLRITNVSETIWFFCEASIPTSHCESGMVGAINPPSISMYDQFVSAARLVTATPTPSPSFIASGQGAFATNSPMPTSISLSVDSFSLASSTPTTSSLSATSTAPAASEGSGSHLTLIAGCATAGGVVIVILIVLTVFHCRRLRAYHYAVGHSKANDLYHDHQDKPPGLVSTDSSTAATHIFPTMGTPSTTLLSRADDTDAHPSSPSRAVRPLPRTPSHNQLRQANVDGRGNAAADPQALPDINALAMEVASVLLHTPPRPGARQHPNSSRNNSAVRTNHKRKDESGWYESSDEADPSAPPHYRAN
ncbi:hypothetical protein B0H12DRAFT_540681 [Mycena haematopus]|nr:hypothetical protein B0H12DRAFT_540681 [Mycena haematopus]